MQTYAKQLNFGKKKLWSDYLQLTLLKYPLFRKGVYIDPYMIHRSNHNLPSLQIQHNPHRVLDSYLALQGASLYTVLLVQMYATATLPQMPHPSNSSKNHQHLDATALKQNNIA